MITPSPNNSSDPRWFVLAMAYRWPASMLLAVLVLAGTAVRILQQPLPVALPQTTPLSVKVVGGVKVDQIDLPTVLVQVAGDQPLPVTGAVKVTKPVQVQGGVNVGTIEGPVDVGSFANPVPVTGSVSVKEIGGKIKVKVSPLPGGGLLP